MTSYSGLFVVLPSYLKKWLELHSDADIAKYCSFSGHAHEQVRQMERRKELSEPARLNFPKSQALDFHSLLKAQLRRWSVSSHRVHVSMSHISSHSGHYHTLHEWVFGDTWRYGQTWVLFDYSAPTGDPIHSARQVKELAEAIFRRVARFHVVISVGMYATHSKSIRREIRGSQALRESILAVSPRAQEPSWSIVGNAANVLIRCSTKRVVDGPRQLYHAAQPIPCTNQSTTGPPHLRLPLRRPRMIDSRRVEWASQLGNHAQNAP